MANIIFTGVRAPHKIFSANTDLNKGSNAERVGRALAHLNLNMAKMKVRYTIMTSFEHPIGPPVAKVGLMPVGIVG